MTQDITIPIWLFLVLLALAVWAVFDHVMIPGVRWYLHQQIEQAIEIINRHLVIEIRPFQLTKRQVLIDRVVYDPEVMETVRSHAQAKDLPRAVLFRKVTGYAKEIIPAFNAIIYFRVGYWIARLVSRALYRVRLGTVSREQFRSIDPDATVVFVMNHRSNMDYILLSLMAAESTALSYAVGEWAKIWPIQTLIRSLGGYFVRRKTGNPLYRKVLERYVHMATKEGVCQALFPEGKLSRDGRLHPLKLGILDYMLRSFNPETDRNIIFIPVGINYDRTLEDRTLLRELDPLAERRSRWFVTRRTFSFAFQNLRLMMRRRWHRFGYAGVHFGTPISVAGFCLERGVCFSELERKDRFLAIEKLAEYLGRAIERVIPVLPIGIIATVFLNDPERPLTALEIKAAAHELLLALKEKNAPIYPDAGKMEESLEKAINLMTLRHMLAESDSRFKIAPEMEALLSYYANALAHYF